MRELMEGNTTISVVSIQGTSSHLLRQVVQRIRQQVRTCDMLWLLETTCAVLLPGTPLEGAKAIARRLSQLLVDIEYEMHVLYGPTAQVLLLQMQSDPRMVIVNKDTGLEAMPWTGEAMKEMPVEREPGDDLPYLAFIGTYPALRLLHLFPYDLACRYRCVPVGAERKLLTVATCKRLECAVVQQFQVSTRRELFQVRCEPSLIDDVLHYWRRSLLLDDVGERVVSD